MKKLQPPKIRWPFHSNEKKEQKEIVELYYLLTILPELIDLSTKCRMTLTGYNFLERSSFLLDNFLISI